jgi:regulator of cell morphogenesis and NO signaling
MSAICVHDTIGQLVARRPALSHAFEAAGVDYCCGGKKTLEEACREKGLDPNAFVARLEQAALATAGAPVVDAAAMSLTELADHIERTHHAYLRDALPRLDMLTERVASVHGADDPRLREVRKTLLAFAGELTSHMMKEEQVLFPMIRRLESSDTPPAFHCGSIANPIRQMELEHHDAGAALERMRTLTDEYTPPTWACNTYRAMLDAIGRLERDMHQHVHKEDNVLFPSAATLESTLTERTHA